MNKKLYRSKHNKIIFGICGGMGDFLNVNPLIIRLLFVFSGIGIGIYFVLYCFIPETPML